jgi:hypothetical protein
MEQTPEDKKVLHADNPTPEDQKAESLTMVEVVNLLQGNLVRTTRLMWCQLFFIGALIVLLFVAYFSLLGKIPSTRNVAALGPKPLEKPPPISETIPTPQVHQTQQQVLPAQQSAKPADVSERKELQSVLDQVRKAQMEKDINLFLQAYSPTYPNLPEKKEDLLRSWQKYNYLDMNFNIGNIQKKNAHTIIAEVACDITLEDIHSKKKSNLTKDYIINFSDISGKTLIQEVTQDKKRSGDGSSGSKGKML